MKLKTGSWKSAIPETFWFFDTIYKALGMCSHLVARLEMGIL